MINTNDLIMNEESIISTFINPKFKDLFLDDDQMAIVDNFFSKYDTNVTSSQSKYSVGIIRKKERDYNEVKKYIKEDVLDESATFSDVLKYWENKKNEYPTLYKTSQKYLSYLSSSCSSERLFSQSSSYIDKRRTRILPSNVESQCVIRSYILTEGTDIFLN